LIIHQPAFVENSVGNNMFIGYHPEGDGGFVSRIAILPMNILDDGDRERFCMQQAIEFIQQNPVESARRILVRLIKFIGPEDREFFFFYINNMVGAIPQPWLAFIYSLLVIPWATILIFGTIGLWHTRDLGLILLVVLFLLGYGFPHFLIIAEPRFHLAWVPVLMPFAAYGWVSIRKIHWMQGLERENLIVVVLLLLIIIIFISGFVMNFPKLSAIMSAGGNKLYYSY